MRNFYALVSFGFCLFVALTVIMEFYKGARAIAAKNGMNLVRATVELTHRNTRRYGGYLVHMGIVLMFIGFTGHAFNQNEVKELNNGDTMRVGTYTLQHDRSAAGRKRELRRGIAPPCRSSKNGDDLGTLEPEKRFYKASRQGTSEVGIRQRPNEDLYLNFGGMSDDNQRAVIQAYVFPLVSLDLDRRPGADRRHADLPGPEQDQNAIRPHRSRGHHEETCDASKLVCWPSLVGAAQPWRKPHRKSPAADVRRVGARLQCKCGCKDSVATCSMLECSFSKPAKERIARMQSCRHERPADHPGLRAATTAPASIWRRPALSAGLCPM